MLQCKRSLSTLILTSLVAGLASADEAPPNGGEPVTLMGMLMEWRYPDAQFHDASMSDAAVMGVGAVKCKSILTTPDSAEKVMAFYLKKLHVDADGKNLDEKEGERITTERSVLIQDVSEGAAKLHVIAVNGTVDRKAASTTLVISRADDDETTRIAWSSYRQLTP